MLLSLRVSLQVLVQRLQKDILPKIESQIAELAKQDEPNDATKAISKQLKVLIVSKIPLCVCHAQWLATCMGTCCACRPLLAQHVWCVQLAVLCGQLQLQSCL